MLTYGIPNDMIKSITPIAGIVITPLIQNGLYPFLEKRKIKFGPVARITAGFAILALAMVYTAVLQKMIYNSGPCYDHPLSCAEGDNRSKPNDISVFLQAPIYIAGAITEVFCLTTGTEYAYNQAPASMKSLVQAIWLAMAGIGGLFALGLSPLANDPYLVTMYSICAGLLGVATVAMWAIFGYLDKLPSTLIPGAAAEVAVENEDAEARPA